MQVVKCTTLRISETLPDQQEIMRFPFQAGAADKSFDYKQVCTLPKLELLTLVETFLEVSKLY